MSEALTDPNGDAKYLADHPEMEKALWGEWVLTVCQWKGMHPPIPSEWTMLQEKWYSGIAPVDSVVYLQRIRASGPVHPV